MKINNLNKYKKQKQTFGAKIWVTETPNFQKLPLQILRRTNKYVGEPWDVYRSIKRLDEGYTDDMSICTAGFIQNGSDGFLLHLQPGNKNNPKEVVENTIIDAISNLKEANNKVTAFLTGGYAHYIDDYDDELYFIIKDVLKSEKVPFSSVWGHKNLHWTDLYASANTQKYVVNHNRDRQVVKNRQDVEKIYEDVFLHKRDEFVF